MKKSVFIPIFFLFFVVLIALALGWMFSVRSSNLPRVSYQGINSDGPFGTETNTWCLSTPKPIPDSKKRLVLPQLPPVNPVVAVCPPKAPFYTLVRHATKGAFVIDHFIKIPHKEFEQVGLIPMMVRGPNGHRTLAWATTNAKAIVLGNVISTSGKDLSFALLHPARSRGAAPRRGEPAVARRPPAREPPPARLDRAPRRSPAASQLPTVKAKKAHGPGWLFDRLSTLHGVVLTHPRGKIAGTLYVLGDPNCPFCEEFYHRLAPSFKKIGKAGVRIVWSPVAFLKVSSIARAERILAGGASALRENETHFDALHERGGLPDKPIVSEKSRVIAATQAFFDSGIQVATPTLVWRDRHGRAHFITGVPDNRQFGAAMATMAVGHK